MHLVREAETVVETVAVRLAGDWGHASRDAVAGGFDAACVPVEVDVDAASRPDETCPRPKADASSVADVDGDGDCLAVISGVCYCDGDRDDGGLTDGS